MFNSQEIGTLSESTGPAPKKAPSDGDPYCFDCFTEKKIKKSLPDGWWGEKRRILIKGRWYALCHVHYNKRQ